MSTTIDVHISSPVIDHFNDEYIQRLESRSRSFLGHFAESYKTAIWIDEERFYKVNTGKVVSSVEKVISSKNTFHLGLGVLPLAESDDAQIVYLRFSELLNNGDAQRIYKNAQKVLSHMIYALQGTNLSAGIETSMPRGRSLLRGFKVSGICHLGEETGLASKIGLIDQAISIDEINSHRS